MSTTQPSGPTVSDVDSKGIRDTLAQTTDAALMHDGFATLPTYLQKRGAEAYGTPAIKAGTKGQPANGDTTDRQVGTKLESSASMVGPFHNADDINSAVDQLRKDFKDKYNSDFNISSNSEAMVFDNSFRVMQGDLGETARTAGETIPPADANNPAQNNGTDNPNDANRAMHMASVVLPSGDNFDGGTLRMTNVGRPAGDWKIHLRHDVNEQQIHDALLKQLNALHDNRNNWPSDQNTAERVISAHILSVFVSTGNQSMPTGDMPNNPANAPTGTNTPQ
jgi:hypothetical protein